MKIVIDQQGNVRMVVSKLVDESLFTTAEKRRASHVLPWNPWLRALFVRLRRWFGETGRIAELTRRFPGAWLVDLSPSNGPTFGPFHRREWAIRFEVAWLERNAL